MEKEEFLRNYVNVRGHGFVSDQVVVDYLINTLTDRVRECIRIWKVEQKKIDWHKWRNVSKFKYAESDFYKYAGREIRTPELREHKLSRLAPYQARLSQLKAIPIP